MMEDAMLIYRLDKSIERRVFKVNVGAIDENDVPAFIQEFANNFKRTPIIDPLTGQIDLRKNFLDVSSDYFIPVRDPSTPTPIENLPSAQNPTSMDDIQYMQNKVFSALRVPKTFLNFQEAQGKGQNLSLLDIRMARMVNTIQQFLLMELNKIAIIHLHLLGLDDELTNFSLSLNNPSAQIEALELEDLTKRINTATAAIQSSDIGMPLMSLHFALKHIMKLSDAEIKDMLNEIRLEKAMASELEQTAQIIKHTGMFDTVDNIYGDYEAMNNPQPQQQQQGEDGLGGGPGGPGGPGGGGGFDGGALASDSLGGGSDMMGGADMMSGPDMSTGSEVGTDMANAPDVDSGKPMESNKRRKNMINEIKPFMREYFNLLSKNENESETDTSSFDKKTNIINEDFNQIFGEIDKLIHEGSELGGDDIENDEIDDIDSELYNSDDE